LNIDEAVEKIARAFKDVGVPLNVKEKINTI